MSKKLILISKYKIKGKSKYVICLTERTFIDKNEDKYGLESELEIYLQFFVDWYYKSEMESHCLKCRKYTENIDPQVSSTSNGRTMILSKCTICNSKKSKYIKNQEAKGLLSKLGVKTPLNKIPILGDILF